MVSDDSGVGPGIIGLRGGYDDGYASCPCFWGRSPGSLVRRFLATQSVKGLRVLDLGCGEGKNAYAFSQSGAVVVAVDCSELALRNGRAEFSDAEIEWVRSDSASYLRECEPFEIIVMYGLLHCMDSPSEISTLIHNALWKTNVGGYHLVASFNNGPHDLSAHPNFAPTLVSHEFYLSQYAQHKVLTAERAVIHETHPHNGIRHFHSLTRLMVRKLS